MEVHLRDRTFKRLIHLVLFMCINLKALKVKKLGHDVKTLVKCEAH